jgi:hypothetical protein
MMVDRRRGALRGVGVFATELEVIEADPKGQHDERNPDHDKSVKVPSFEDAHLEPLVLVKSAHDMAQIRIELQASFDTVPASTRKVNCT